MRILPTVLIAAAAGTSPPARAASLDDTSLDLEAGLRLDDNAYALRRGQVVNEPVRDVAPRLAATAAARVGLSRHHGLSLLPRASAGTLPDRGLQQTFTGEPSDTALDPDPLRGFDVLGGADLQWRLRDGPTLNAGAEAMWHDETNPEWDHVYAEAHARADHVLGAHAPSLGVLASTRVFPGTDEPRMSYINMTNRRLRAQAEWRFWQARWLRWEAGVAAQRDVWDGPMAVNLSYFAFGDPLRLCHEGEVGVSECPRRDWREEAFLGPTVLLSAGRAGDLALGARAEQAWSDSTIDVDERGYGGGGEVTWWPARGRDGWQHALPASLHLHVVYRRVDYPRYLPHPAYSGHRQDYRLEAQAAARWRLSGPLSLDARWNYVRGESNDCDLVEWARWDPAAEQQQGLVPNRPRSFSCYTRMIADVSVVASF